MARPKKSFLGLFSRRRTEPALLGEASLPVGVPASEAPPGPAPAPSPRAGAPAREPRVPTEPDVPTEPRLR